MNKITKAALEALSSVSIDIKKNYQLQRALQNITMPSSKLLYRALDWEIKLDDYEIPVRIFKPREQRSDEIIIFFHGGGWVTGNIENYTKPCAVLGDSTGRRVISVDYRLAPECPFPMGLNDCYAVCEQLIEKSPLLNTDPQKIILMGDSAGGNLAAALSLMARDRGNFSINRQILLYPVTYNNHSETSPFESTRENATGYLLTTQKIIDYMELYAPYADDRNNPYFAPLLSEDFGHQPKTLIITCELDPLRDEGEEYGRKLRNSANDVQIYRMRGALHGFFSMPARSQHLKFTLDLINSFLDGDDTE
ncbi:MAG: alpha/beta hydrolase [Oscillospiraceae bacterium]